jgi:hypothetical protein
MEPERWNQTGKKCKCVIEWIGWGLIELSKDLIWSERMSMMVGVPLKSEGVERLSSIPRVHDSNTLIYSVLILFSK